MNLNQVTVQSKNIPKSVDFYKSLGLILIVENEHYARFEFPEGDSTFSIHLTNEQLTSNTVIYFEVGDLDKTYEELIQKGHKFVSAPTKEDWLWYEARLLDPAGNEICLYSAGHNRKNPPWRIS